MNTNEFEYLCKRPHLGLHSILSYQDLFNKNYKWAYIPSEKNNKGNALIQDLFYEFFKNVIIPVINIDNKTKNVDKEWLSFADLFKDIRDIEKQHVLSGSEMNVYLIIEKTMTQYLELSEWMIEKDLIKKYAKDFSDKFRNKIEN